MTLDNIECQNKGFYRFFGEFRLRDTFQEQIVPKSIEIDKDKQQMKFLALNIDFDGPCHDFIGSRKPVHDCIKEQYLRKSRYFTIVGQFFVKTVAGHHWHAAITTSTSDELFSRINIDDYDRPWNSKMRGFIDFCDLWLQRRL